MTLVSPADSSSSRSGSVCAQIEAVLNSVASLQGAVAEGSQDQATQSAAPLPSQRIQSDVSQLQTAFQALLQVLESTDLEAAEQQAIRSYQTEAHRRSRLLKITAMQLQIAKQPQKLKAVRSQLQDHLFQLQQFLQAIEQALCT